MDEHVDLARFGDVPEAHWAYYEIMEACIPHEFIKFDSYQEWEI